MCWVTEPVPSQRVNQIHSKSHKQFGTLTFYTPHLYTHGLSIRRNDVWCVLCVYVDVSHVIKCFIYIYSQQRNCASYNHLYGLYIIRNDFAFTKLCCIYTKFTVRPSSKEIKRANNASALSYFNIHNIYKKRR